MDGSASTDGSSGTDSSTTDSAVDTDACKAMWSTCQNCAANNCSMELVACTMDTACKSALTALASCVNACGSNCKQTFQSSSGMAGPGLAVCLASSCAKDCP